jgi:hypothetical protein
MIQPRQRVQESPGKAAAHRHLLMRIRGLCDYDSCKRKQDWGDAERHSAKAVCHVVASTRRRRPKNQNMDTEPIA